MKLQVRVTILTGTRTHHEKILLSLVLLLAPVSVAGQTTLTYYAAPSIAALKALTTRPAVVEVVDANPGVFNWSTTPCSAADDIFQVTPTSGPTGCYIRQVNSYAVGKVPTSQAVTSAELFSRLT